MYNFGRYETKRARVKTGDTVFTFSCAQSMERAHAEKVAREGLDAKGRDRRRMNRFDCDGWLHIAVSDTSALMDIKIKHEESHIGYLDIELPKKWKEYIEAHARTQTPGEVSFSDICRVSHLHNMPDLETHPTRGATRQISI